jgi:hypothetical protein
MHMRSVFVGFQGICHWAKIRLDIDYADLRDIEDNWIQCLSC